MTHDDETRYGCPACLSVFRVGFSRCPNDGSVLQQLADDPLVGTTIADRYVIEKFIGEGGMGRVYRARHQRVSRRFAIKVLFGDFATDPKMRDRFSREAEAASRLSHPNVISVVDFGETDDGLLYLAMDYVDGRELQQVIQGEGPFSADRMIAIAKHLCLGLAHAHEEGLVHRDFKAENVILAERGGEEIPRIVDFGIAVMLEGADERLTADGIVVGTPAWMSPEQATGGDLDARSDLFALGILFYKMLAGVMPFEGDMMAVVRQNLSAEPPFIEQRVPGLKVEPRLEGIARKLMAKKPDERYQSAREVLEALEGAQVMANVSRTDVVAKPSQQRAGLTGAMVAIGASVLIAGALGLVMIGTGGQDTGSEQVDGGATSGALAAAPPGTNGLGGESPPPQQAQRHSQVQASDETVTVRIQTVAFDAAPSPAGADVESAARTRTRDRNRRSKDAVADKKTSGANTADSTTSDVKTDATGGTGPQGKTGTNDKAKTAAPDLVTPQEQSPVTAQDFTRTYVAVGEALEKLRQQSPDKAAPLRKEYSSIPLNDALRVPSMREEMDRKLRRLRREIDKELSQ